MQEQEHNEANSTFTDAHGICTFCLTSVLHCWFICEHVSTQCAWQTYKLTSWSRALSNMRECSVFLFFFSKFPPYSLHHRVFQWCCEVKGFHVFGKAAEGFSATFNMTWRYKPSILGALFFFRCNATLWWLFNYLSFSVLGHISHLSWLTLSPRQGDSSVGLLPESISGGPHLRPSAHL